MTTQPDPCSLLPFLPPFVRAQGTPSEELLEKFLCIFEAILIGRSDAPRLSSTRDGRPRADQPFEKMIDRLPELFDPWWTPSSMLPFLSARLALALDDKDTEERKRALIEMAVSIYKQRWLKRGLYRFLELYASTAAQPRVAIDDGESLFAGYLKNDGDLVTVDLHPIAFARPGPPELPRRLAPGTSDPVREELRQSLENRFGAALTHPIAMAVGQRPGLAGGPATREIVVADLGPQDLPGETQRVALWRLGQNGQFLDWTNGPQSVPRPMNAHDPDPKLLSPWAVVADADGSYLVLDRRSSEVFRYTSNGRLQAPVVPKSQLNAGSPVDMAFDNLGRLLVLDQSPPRVLRVSIGVPSTNPDFRKEFLLGTSVLMPTAMMLEPAGTVLITDAGKQNSNSPGDLVRLTLDSVPNVVSLLGSIPAHENPLLFPSDLVAGPDGSVLVCDWGLKNDTPDISLNRVVAEPAGLFRIDLPSPSGVTPVRPARITRVRLNIPLVTPVHIAWDDQRLLVLDFGSTRPSSTEPDINKREWRTKPHEFGVVVDFSASRPFPGNEQQQAAARQQFFVTLTDILNRERPAHVTWKFRAQPGSAGLGRVAAANPAGTNTATNASTNTLDSNSDHLLFSPIEKGDPDRATMKE